MAAAASPPVQQATRVSDLFEPSELDLLLITMAVDLLEDGVIHMQKHLRVYDRLAYKRFGIPDYKDAQLIDNGKVIKCAAKFMNKDEGKLFYDFLSSHNDPKFPNIKRVRVVGFKNNGDDVFVFDLININLKTKLEDETSAFFDPRQKLAPSNFCKKIFSDLAKVVEYLSSSDNYQPKLGMKDIYFVGDKATLAEFWHAPLLNIWTKLGALFMEVMQFGLERLKYHNTCMTDSLREDVRHFNSMLKAGQITSFSDFALHPCFWTSEQKVNFVYALNKEVNPRSGEKHRAFEHDYDGWLNWNHEVSKTFDKPDGDPHDYGSSVSEFVRFLRNVFRHQTKILARNKSVLAGSDADDFDRYMLAKDGAYLNKLIKLVEKTTSIGLKYPYKDI